MGRFITQALVSGATLPFLLKGGYVRQLEPQMSWDTLARHKAKQSPDWGALKKEELIGRKPYPRLVLACMNPECKKMPATFKGKTEEQALIRAWTIGWYYKMEDGAEVCFCPKCKPGVKSDSYKRGAVMHNRADGELYKVLHYVGKGEHILNLGCWPELWCRDKSGSEKVFIFWEGKCPSGLVERGKS